MVARGDLGVEMAIEKYRQFRSRLSAARLHGKFVITAHKWLESMINIVPDASEVSDVANAIYEGRTPSCSRGNIH